MLKPCEAGLVYDLPCAVCVMNWLLQVLRDVLIEHDWDFDNALGSLLLFSSESGE